MIKLIPSLGCNLLIMVVMSTVSSPLEILPLDHFPNSNELISGVICGGEPAYFLLDKFPRNFL
jgi:hypothetical protein